MIKELKKNIDKNKTVILDCPPGTSCPMVAAVGGSDFCLLVTEPSPFGLNDLKLAVETVQKLGVKHGVFINRADASSHKIESYCRRENIEIVGSLGFDMDIAKKYSRGEIIAKEQKYKNIFLETAQKCAELCGKSLQINFK